MDAFHWSAYFFNAFNLLVIFPNTKFYSNQVRLAQWLGTPLAIFGHTPVETNPPGFAGKGVCSKPGMVKKPIESPRLISRNTSPLRTPADLWAEYYRFAIFNFCFNRHFLGQPLDYRVVGCLGGFKFWENSKDYIILSHLHKLCNLPFSFCDLYV